jgi:hypothetical protein
MKTAAHVIESDADSLRSSVSQALRDKKVTLGGVDYRIVEVFKGDSLNSKPHWKISLVPEGASFAVSYLVLNPIRAGSKYLGAEQIVTDEAYRRKGLATFLYLYAAERFGKPFARSRKQSDLGADLWKGRLKDVFSKASQAVESLLSESESRYWTPEELELPKVEGDRGTFPRYMIIADGSRTEIKSIQSLRRALTSIYAPKPRVFVNAGKGITIDFDS